MANRYSDFRVYRVKDMHVCELQVEDYRNASMIECKMGISADSLVLIHSSSKVSDQEPLVCSGLTLPYSAITQFKYFNYLV